MNNESESGDADCEPQEAPPTDKKNWEPPDYSTLRSTEELQLCYEEMWSIGKELRTFRPAELLAPGPFDSVDAGVRACRELAVRVHAAQEAAAAAGSEKKERKRVAAPAKKAPAPRKAAGKKTPAKAPAKAPTKRAASNGEVTRMRWRPDQVITWKGGSENPARPGTGRHERVALLMKHDGKTVKKFLDAGGRTSTLTHNEEAGNIKIT